MRGMLAGCRVDEQEKSSGSISKSFPLGQRFSDATNHPPFTAPLWATRLNGAKLAVIALALFFSTYTQADSAADNYKAHCSACHGATGAGDTMIGRNLKLRPLSSAEVQKQSDDELFAIISKGKGKDRMPAFDRRLSKDQIRDVVKYLRLLKK